MSSSVSSANKKVDAKNTRSTLCRAIFNVSDLSHICYSLSFPGVHHGPSFIISEARQILLITSNTRTMMKEADGRHLTLRFDKSAKVPIGDTILCAYSLYVTVTTVLSDVLALLLCCCMAEITLQKKFYHQNEHRRPLI